MRLVVDSSVFVAAFREQERYSREAFRILEKLEKGKISVIVPVTVILEVIAAIKRRTGNTKLALSVGMRILSFPEISLIEINTFRMTQFLDLAGQSELAGMDAIVVGVAREFDASLVTLDEEILDRGASFVKTTSIREIG